MSLVVYTAIYGGYDPLRTHPEHPDVDEWVCYTDTPALSAPGWTTVVEPARYSHPRLSAKWRKCHPPLGFDRSIWIDGSIHLHNPDYIDVLLGLLDGADLAMFPHPDRGDIRSEAQASLDLVPSKYKGLPVHEQVSAYERRVDISRLGLWASTTIGRNHTPGVLQMGAAWLAHNECWTYQDQLSLPVLIHDYGLPVAGIPHSLRHNPWFTWCGHNRND